EKLSSEISLYNKWLESGYNATMNWMENNIDKREDVGLIVENAKSVLTLAYPYKTEFEHGNPENSGKIARYAWGTDYHTFLPDKLKLICEEIKISIPEMNFRYYVDTGPVLER